MANTGTADLHLGAIAGLPAGFSLASGFSVTTLAPGASTTFAVRFDADAAGTFAGRVSLVTDDGAGIFMHYNGIGSAEVDGKHQLRSAPLFETSDERYAWLNDIQAVGIGVAVAAEGVVRYKVYALR